MLPALIAAYGYLGVFIGTVTGGETILLPAAFLSARGYFDIRWVITIACIGSFLGDQVFFFIGRTKGFKSLLDRKAVRSRAEALKRIPDQWRDFIALSFRFYFGFRMAVLIALGTSTIKYRRFVLLNFIGAVLWSLSFGLLGYWFGYWLEGVFAEIGRYEIPIALVIFALILTGMALFSKFNSRNSGL